MEYSCGEDEGLNFILQRHSTAMGAKVKYHIASSIWGGLDRIHESIHENIRWIPGVNSKLQFWTDKWLRFVIAEKIGIPQNRWKEFDQLVSDFRDDADWKLDEQFVENYPEISSAIVAVKIASRTRDFMVWEKHKSSNITSKVAYELCRVSFPRVDWGKWIWAAFIPPVRCSILFG